MKPRLRTLTRLLMCCLCLIPLGAKATESVVIIGHSDVPNVTQDAVQKLFTGRTVAIDGVLVTPVNAQSGAQLRADFLQTFLNQTEEKYQAYWTVRQFVGKGRPPRNLTSTEEIIKFVRTTKGAVGYLYAKDVPEGVNILLRK